MQLDICPYTCMDTYSSSCWNTLTQLHSTVIQLYPFGYQPYLFQHSTHTYDNHIFGREYSRLFICSCLYFLLLNVLNVSTPVTNHRGKVILFNKVLRFCFVIFLPRTCVLFYSHMKHTFVGVFVHLYLKRKLPISHQKSILKLQKIQSFPQGYNSCRLCSNWAFLCALETTPDQAGTYNHLQLQLCT